MNSAFTLFHGRWRGQNCLGSDLPCFAYNCHSSICSAMLISERGKFPLAWRWPFSTFHRRMCFSVSQFINNRILAKRKLFFLGRIISTKWLLPSFIQGNGQKKTSEVFIWIFKSRENKQSRYAAIPSSSHRQNDANTSLQRAVTLAFIGPCQLLIGGGRR